MKRSWLSFPYLIWMIIFTVIPLALVLFYSVVVFENGTMVLSLDNFKRVLEPIYLTVFFRSLKIAVIKTLPFWRIFRV